ncbi:MAG: hypothetical protein AAGF53_11885 [Pseudomonadota bacterium]
MRSALFLLCLFLSGPAFALSCMQPDVAQAYKVADEAEEVFWVVKGALEFDQDLVRIPDFTDNSPKDTKVPARFDGHVLSKSGFETQFETDLVLELLCYGPWCAQAESGLQYLAFVEHTGTGYVMRVNPCYSSTFLSPTPEQLEQAWDCMRGLECEPSF